MKRGNTHQCSNLSTESYTGKESSPKGLGYSAVGYELGVEKEGADKQIWVVHIKNNKKVWFRKKGMAKVTHEEPIINSSDDEVDNDDGNIVTNTQIVIATPKLIDEPKIIPEEKTTEKVEKKQTNYNIFLTYYQSKLKAENVAKKLNKTNKVLFAEAIVEWNRIKENKVELQELIESIKSK